MRELKGKPIGELQEHLDIIIPVLSDQLFIKLGIHSEQLDGATEYFGLETDPQYIAMQQSFS